MAQENFKILLDGTELQTLPKDLNEAELVISRAQQLKGLFLTCVEKLTFIGDGFDYINSVYESNGYCSDIDVVILFAKSENNYSVLFSGIIRVSEVVFNISKATAECEIQDNSFYALIQNNRQIKFPLNTNLSKNGVSITAITPRLIAPLDSNDESYETGREFAVYDVKESFRLLVACMTDNVINTVDSDWYDGLDDADNLGLAKGEAIRTASSTISPEVSFGDLFTEINKKYNIGMGLEKQTDGTYHLRIEPEDYFYSASKSPVKLTAVAELTREIDTTKLYANIKLGSNITNYDNSGVIRNLPQIRLLGFEQEEYYVGGQCNTDISLDTQSNAFIIDHNTINDLVMDGTDKSHDNDTFLIQHEATGLLASYWTINGVTGWFYNEELRNDKVLERHKLQGVVAKYVNTNDTCDIVKTTTQTGQIDIGSDIFIWDNWQEILITLENEVSDPSNRWTGTNKYTASASGVYTFDLNYVFDGSMSAYVLSSAGGQAQSSEYVIVYGVYLEHFDSGNNPVATYDLTSSATVKSSDSFSTTLSSSKVVVMSSGDYVQYNSYVSIVAKIGFANISGGLNYYYSNVVADQDLFKRITFDYSVLPNCQIECVGSTNGGGIFKESDQGVYKTSLYKMEFPLSLEEFQNWIDFPINTILFNHRMNAAYKEASLNIARFKLQGGLTNIELISNE